MLPVALRHIPFGNRNQAGNPGFRSQQIVVTRVEPFGAGGVADVEQLAMLIEQKAKIHCSDCSVRLSLPVLENRSAGV